MESIGLITVREAAERLGIAVSTVHKRISTGQYPVAFKVDGKTGAYLLDPKEIDRIAARMEARTV